MIEPAFAHPPSAVTERARPRGQLAVVGGENAAFTRGHRLRVLEAEGRADTETTDALSVPFRTMGVGGVFDDRDFLFACDLSNAVHVGRQAAKVNNQCGARAIGNGGGDLLRVDVVSVAIDINKYRDSPDSRNRGRGGDEAMRGDDDFVALPDARGGQGQLESQRTGGRGDAVLAIMHPGEEGFEPGDHFAVATPFP